MTLWIVAALIVAGLVPVAVVWTRLSRRRVQPEHVAEARQQAHETVSSLRPDDWTDLSDAVTAPKPVLTVYRLHTGELDCRDSDLTVRETRDLANHLHNAALRVCAQRRLVEQTEDYLREQTQ